MSIENEASEHKQYGGNPQMEDGYVPIANELLEALAKTKLNSSESRLLFCIARKTYGWRKSDDWISLSQIIEMTGMRASQVCHAKKYLRERNIIAYSGKRVGINKHYREWLELPKQAKKKRVKSSLPTQAKVLPKSASTLPKHKTALPDRGDTKDTVTRNTHYKKTDTKDMGAAAPRTLRTLKDQAIQFFSQPSVHVTYVQDFAQRGFSAELVQGELEGFISFWTEKNGSGSKVRWQKERPYFDLESELFCWLLQRSP